MIPSKQVIILLCAFFALCCSSSASVEPPVQCETEEDLDYKTCNLNDLSDQALIDMCNRVGIDILHQDFYGPYLYTPRYTHGELVGEAHKCLKGEDAKKAIKNIMKMAYANVIGAWRATFDIVDDPQDRRVFIEYALSSLDDKERSLGYKILLGEDYVGDDDDVDKSINHDLNIGGSLSTAIELHGLADRVEEIQETLAEVLYLVHEYNTKYWRQELLRELLSPDNADDDEHREYIRMIIRATNGKKLNTHAVVSFLLSRENINEEERPMMYATLMKFAEEYERMYYEDEEQCIDTCCIDDDQQQEVDILVEKEATLVSHLVKVGLCILLLLGFLAYGSLVHFIYYLRTPEYATAFENFEPRFDLETRVYALLLMPIDWYNAQIIKKTIYVWSSHAKKLNGKRGRKKKELLNKTGLKEMTVGTTAEDIIVGITLIDNHIPVQLTGNRQAVQKAITLIQEAIGVQNVIAEKFSKPSQTQAPPEEVDEADPQPLQDVNDGLEAERENSSGSDISLEQSADTHVDMNGSTDITMTDEQQPIVNENENDLYEKASSEPSTPATFIVSAEEEEEEEEVSFEVGINSSQGVAPETNDEGSTSSSHSGIRSTIPDESVSSVGNDSLLLFLRSQHQSIKGSVDEFYTWLKGEDIDSMVALQEAVCDEDYLNNTMKVGNGTSGLKGFKRKVFQCAVREYADAKRTNSDHPLSQNTDAFIPSNLFSEEQKPSSHEVALTGPPEELVCPISLVLMTNDPVVAADGITYERASIENWFQKSLAKVTLAQENLKRNPNSESDQRVVIDGICSPVHGTRLVNLLLVSNIGIRNMAREYKEKKMTRVIGPPPGF